MPVKVTRLVVGKGKTTKPTEAEEWHKTYYEMEAEVPETYTLDSLEEIRVQMEYIIDGWLSEGEVEAVETPQLDMAEIQTLVWISYKTKKPCEAPDEPGWIFSDPSRHEPEKQEIVSRLALAIEGAPENKLQLGETIYRFSGPKEDPRLFISRRSVEKPLEGSK